MQFLDLTKGWQKSSFIVEQRQYKPFYVPILERKKDPENKSNEIFFKPIISYVYFPFISIHLTFTIHVTAQWLTGSVFKSIRHGETRGMVEGLRGSTQAYQTKRGGYCIASLNQQKVCHSIIIVDVIQSSGVVQRGNARNLGDSVRWTWNRKVKNGGNFWKQLIYSRLLCKMFNMELLLDNL